MNHFDNSSDQFTHSFVRSFIHSFIHSLTRSFTHDFSGQPCVVESLGEIETHEYFSVDGDYDGYDRMNKHKCDINEIEETYVLEEGDDREFVKSSSVEMSEHDQFEICIHFEISSQNI